MKKFLIVIALLSLVCSASYAVDMNSAVTGEFAAQNRGRSVATDSSVVLKVWATDGASDHPGIGVSSSSTIIVYSDYLDGEGYSIDSQNSSYDTIGEIVDYINTNFSSDSTVRIRAAVGSDAYRDMAADALLRANIVAIGTTKDDAGTVKSASSKRMSVGVEGKDGFINRIKEISCQMPVSVGKSASGVTLAVYDGNTKVYQKFTGVNALYTAADASNSANTVKLDDAKGLSAAKGNSICVVASTDGNSVDSDTHAKAVANISIIYDQLQQ